MEKPINEITEKEVLEKNNACPYTKEELLVMNTFKVLKFICELCKPENKSKYTIKEGDIIEERCFLNNGLVFSTEYIRRIFGSQFTFEEMSYLLRLCRISGEMVQATTADGISYWGNNGKGGWH